MIDVPRTCNSIMVATVRPTAAGNLLANLALMGEETHPLLRLAVQSAYDNLAGTPQGGPVFTDDRAPTEQLTDRILVNFLLSGSAQIPCF